jgi:uncharacterized protein
MQKVIDNALIYVKEIFEKEYSGHDYFHTLRVYKTATSIAIKEKANLQVVQLAALLHDIDDRKLSPLTHKNKDNARKFLLNNGVSLQVINQICDIIEEVSYKGVNCESVNSIESACVQDADRLDALGAIGIARAFAYGGANNRVMHNPEIEPKLNMNVEEYRAHISTTINHFYEKLFNLKDLMNTSTAKAIAKEREEYMKDYIARFNAEWQGEK